MTGLGSLMGSMAHRQPVWTVRSNRKTPVYQGKSVVGDTGIEPVTSSVSGKRATAAPIAHVQVRIQLSFRGGYGI